MHAAYLNLLLRLILLQLFQFSKAKDDASTKAKFKKIMDRIAGRSGVITAADVSTGSPTDLSNGVDAEQITAKVKQLEKENEKLKNLLVQSINFHYNFMYTS